MTNDATPEPRDAAPADAVDAPEPREEEQLATEPRQEVTTRKLPTLAVMAALAVQAEARAEVERA